MEYIGRAIEQPLRNALARGRSALLLGPRQTGKSTLLDKLHSDHRVSFIQPAVRQKYERKIELLAQEIEGLPRASRSTVPLVILDEVQKIPEVMDVAQDLIDRHKAQFVLTGSSARKLRRAHANLLPGRVIPFRMDPLSIVEYPAPSLEDRLVYGSLPIMYRSDNAADRETELDSYVTTYLEEEVRAEALVRNLGSFARFLELAAAESGMVTNFRKVSQRIGVSHTTLMDYYQILEDCLLVERIEPFTESKTRHKLTRSQRYLFFDLGVRRSAAREGVQQPKSAMGSLFEQWVGLELVHLLRGSRPKATLHFWRDPAGPEIDWLIRQEKKLLPIEVKWTDSPTQGDVKHLSIFLKEYPEAREGFVVCQTSRRLKLADRIFAIPWRDLPSLIPQA